MIVPATNDTIAQAAAMLRGGQVVVFPTETVYGLGADATSAAAVARVFAIKNRPSFDPLIVHLADATMAGTVAAAWPVEAERLAERFWPGPLTLVLPKRDAVPAIVTAGLGSVALRVPAHHVALELLAQARRPIAAPSANPFGYVSPTTAAHVAAQLGDQVPLILDGGPCRVGLESTIVSLLDRRPALLRAGGLALEAIEAVIGPVRVATERALPIAPGQLPRHYAPRTPIELVAAVRDVSASLRAHAALLLPQPDPDSEGFAHVELLSRDGDITTIAANLFAALHRIDSGEFARIFALPVAETGLGRAVMDRLRRATNPAP
jgi:L-threonylcarbamoyladenylate synthase